MPFGVTIVSPDKSSQPILLGVDAVANIRTDTPLNRLPEFGLLRPALFKGALRLNDRWVPIFDAQGLHTWSLEQLRQDRGI